MDIQDSTNITGISKLFNYEGNSNLEEMEKDIIDDVDSTNEINDVEQYKQQLETLGCALGIDLDEENSEDDDGEDEDALTEEKAMPYRNKSISNRYDNGDINTMFDNVSLHRSNNNSYMNKITEEQKKQQILSHVLNGIDDQNFSVEKEKEEDDKAILLEQVDMLMTSLTDEGIDISRVPVVDNSSAISDIENVHKILRLKNDRNRYCSFAEECILAGSHTLEWMFDGKKTYGCLMGKKHIEDISLI